MSARSILYRLLHATTLAVVGFAQLQASAAAQTLTCGPREFPSSLVRIVRQAPLPPGTGVVIAKRDDHAIIMTAKHVLEEPGDFSIYFRVEPQRRIAVTWDNATVFGWPTDADLAVFRVNAPMPEGVIPEDPFRGEVNDGGRLVAWGFPASRSDGTLCSYEGSLHRKSGGVLVMNRYVDAGVSGGPMFFHDGDGRGKLVGIVVRGVGSANEGSAHAIEIGLAARIVATSPDPRNAGKPHVWPNIVLPGQIADNTGLRTFVKVAAGPFLMGSNFGDERFPAADGRRVGAATVTLPTFYMSKFEVTVAEYSECVKAGVCPDKTRRSDASQGNMPVVGVSWWDAQEYARWLQRRLVVDPRTHPDLRRLIDAGWEIDLPSEEEWEKAARRDGKDVFPWGNDARPSFANYNTGRLQPVGSRQCPTCAYGLADMAGNVREWTRSLKLDYPYVAAKAEDRGSGKRAIRGGSYKRDEEFHGADIVRASNRQEADPSSFDEFTGFRVALICREERGCEWKEPE